MRQTARNDRPADRDDAAAKHKGEQVLFGSEDRIEARPRDAADDTTGADEERKPPVDVSCGRIAPGCRETERRHGDERGADRVGQSHSSRQHQGRHNQKAASNPEETRNQTHAEAKANQAR